MGHLTVILGCMFAQKTTELLRNIRRFRSLGWKVLVINHSVDTRYGESQVSSHDSDQEMAHMVSRLEEVDALVRSGEYQAIAIDEGQFFPDLFEYVTAWVDQCPINVVIAGLDGTSEREPFGDMLRLIPHAEEVLRLRALCAVCRDGTPAIFSQRRGDSSSVISVGGADQYRPVCRKHYIV